jgi:hypothetical protein
LHAGVADDGDEGIDLVVEWHGGGERPPELDRVESGGLGRGGALEQRKLGEKDRAVHRVRHFDSFVVCVGFRMSEYKFCYMKV